MLKGLLSSILYESPALLNLQECPIGKSGGLETSANHEGWALKDEREEELLVPELKNVGYPPRLSGSANTNDQGQETHL